MKRAKSFALSLAGLVSTAAFPQSIVHLNQEGALEMSVATSDLDLTTLDGRKALERRVRRAAALVCPDELGNRDLSLWMERQACVSSAIFSAERKLPQTEAQAGKTVVDSQQLSRR